jgi:hypothetical protein
MGFARVVLQIESAVIPHLSVMRHVVLREPVTNRLVGCHKRAPDSMEELHVSLRPGDRFHPINLRFCE